ncbi:DUF2964 family protein [Glutamicibacter nicotianae]|uniref:DUF2964 family protein n=1 Tax=Glutamicibacter nicotianae TaxID=37929 RepID=UPI0025579412|nr:DUF2964 family protein [Glutamicibacter nicotianae]WIV42602.1 DUF2964 family protein [Glutamicibacter nicotianae]
MSKHVAVTTQSQHPWRATVRTILAVIVALAAMAPSIYGAATMGSPEAATGAAALALGIAAAITRIMALPGVESFFQRFLPWLAAGTKTDEPPAGNVEVTGSATLEK